VAQPAVMETRPLRAEQKRRRVATKGEERKRASIDRVSRQEPHVHGHALTANRGVMSQQLETSEAHPIATEQAIPQEAVADEDKVKHLEHPLGNN